MIAMALVAGIVVLIASRFSTPKNQIREHITELMVLTKKSFQYAQIKNATYRIVFDLTSTDEDDQPKPHKYWVEYANGPQFISAPPESGENPEVQTESAFKRDERALKKVKSLPNGFTFAGISYGGRKEVKEGTAYLYFFPQGFTEESLIQITHKEDNLNWSILVNPLTGISDLISKKVTLKELKQGK